MIGPRFKEGLEKKSFNLQSVAFHKDQIFVAWADNPEHGWEQFIISTKDKTLTFLELNSNGFSIHKVAKISQESVDEFVNQYGGLR